MDGIYTSNKVYPSTIVGPSQEGKKLETSPAS